MKNMKKILGLILVIVLIAAMAVIYNNFKEKPVEGSKHITIEVVDSKGESTVYELHTDVSYLRGAMEAAEGLSFEGEDGEYGLTIMEVNGEVADYNKDGAYWAFYVNDEYCNYGIDEQPVEDGDAFAIVYTVYEE